MLFPSPFASLNACWFPATDLDRIFLSRSAVPFPGFLSTACRFARSTPRRSARADRLSASLCSYQHLQLGKRRPAFRFLSTEERIIRTPLESRFLMEVCLASIQL